MLLEHFQMNSIHELMLAGIHWAIIFAFGLILLLTAAWLVWFTFQFFRQQLIKKTSFAILADPEDYFQSAFEYATEGLALIDANGKFIRVNPALCQILDCSVDEILHCHISRVITVNDKNNFLEDLFAGKIKSYECEQKYTQKNNSIICIKFNIVLIQHHPNSYFVAQFQNITSEKTAEEQLIHLAYHDPLTGLANRNLLQQKTEEVLANARRHRSGFALLLLDLDHFKNINDTIGHDAGDILLQITAERLKTAVRNTDIVARLGGDEFVIVITDVSKVDAIAFIVKKIVDTLLKPLLIKDSEVYITTSIGISLYPYDGHNIQLLMKNADLALYRAKELGRNNYQFCTPEMTAKAREKMARQYALSQAIAKNEFYLEYQPKLDLINWRISGVEALLRWKSTEFGIVTPSEIIKTAEETGLIIPLSEWVLDTATSQVKSWQNQGIEALTLSINLSARQFKQAHFIDNILKILFNNHFSPELLEVEITESLIMQDPDHILRILHVLKQNGMRIAIDDFGTGYSSMDYLKRFSIDKIKIDQSFINKISTDQAYSAIVTAMIAMTHKLGIKTIAEGVETVEQFKFLIAEKCNEIQGYFLSPAVSAETIVDLIKTNELIARVNNLIGVNAR